MDVTAAKAAAAKVFFAAATMVLLAGCESVECDRYRGFVEDNDKYGEAIAWADASIFSHSIPPHDIRELGLVGPGRKRWVKAEDTTSRPPLLQDVEIRLIGDDPQNPRAVFFGRSAFKGLVVARSDVGSALSYSSILPNEVLARNKRAALVCRPFR